MQFFGLRHRMCGCSARMFALGARRVTGLPVPAPRSKGSMWGLQGSPSYPCYRGECVSSMTRTTNEMSAVPTYKNLNAVRPSHRVIHLCVARERQPKAACVVQGCRRSNGAFGEAPGGVPAWTRGSRGAPRSHRCGPSSLLAGPIVTPFTE